MRNKEKTGFAITSETEQATEQVIVEDLSLDLGGSPILKNINFSLPSKGITTLIGPSGAGKSSLLRCMTLLLDCWSGAVCFDGVDVREWPGGACALRRQIGLIHQKPALFPCSIKQNVLFGLARKERKKTPKGLVRQTLTDSALWDEVSHRLDDPAHTSLSVGQQQRLCIARALALSPSALLLDEPTASLDLHSKQLIENSILSLAENMPVMVVTHDLDQARRLGGDLIFMCDGKIIETGKSESFFKAPGKIESKEFIGWSVCDCD